MMGNEVLVSVLQYKVVINDFLLKHLADSIILGEYI